MQTLSKDKSLNARMRFSIEEVIFLRNNKWQSRREHEGPLKLSEIHHRIQQEEERNKAIAAQQQQQMLQYGGLKRGGGDGSYGGIRQTQQQQFYGGPGKGGMPGSKGQSQYQNVNDPAGVYLNPFLDFVKSTVFTSVLLIGKFIRSSSLGPGSMTEGQHLQQNEYLRRMNSDGPGRKPNVGYGHQYGQHQQPPQHQLHHQQQPQHPPHNSSSRDYSQTSQLSFTDENILRRMKGLINEYLSFSE